MVQTSGAIILLLAQGKVKLVLSTSISKGLCTRHVRDKNPVLGPHPSNTVLCLFSFSAFTFAWVLLYCKVSILHKISVPFLCYEILDDHFQVLGAYRYVICICTLDILCVIYWIQRSSCYEVTISSIRKSSSWSIHCEFLLSSLLNAYIFVLLFTTVDYLMQADLLSAPESLIANIKTHAYPDTGTISNLNIWSTWIGCLATASKGCPYKFQSSLNGI